MKSNKLYFSTLSSLSEDELEELVDTLEREAEKHLEKILPPKTDYSIVISIVKKSNSVNVVLDITVRGSIAYSRDFNNVVAETIKHIRDKLTEVLESRVKLQE
ncbi:MAG: hypothetical protein QXO48_03595 [Desulfurococcaceae archaeon]